MKKTFVLCVALGAFGLNTINIQAQKGGTTIPATKLTPAMPKIVNNADSVSYVYGLAMTEGEGFSSFLLQSGIVKDTSAISAEYQFKIEAEKNEAEKNKLKKEFDKAIQETTEENASNIDKFLAGFQETFLEKENKIAHNLGASTATQILATSDKFATELLGDAEAFNKEAFYHAFASSVRGGKPILNVEKPQDVIMKTMEAQHQANETKAKEAQKAKYAKQIKEGEDFLAKNKKKKGVVTLPSGLQYKVITQGKGENPKADEVVNVHYKGTLIDGTQFDSSYDRGEPTTLSMGHIIKGWAEALQLMTVGSKWELYIPYDLGYGESDMGTIKPFSTLIFEVELLNTVNTQELQEQMEKASENVE